MRGIILLTASLFATNVYADTPFYAGGGIGLTGISQDQGVNAADNGQISPSININFDDDETGTTFFAGYELTPRIVIEAGYIDFGSVDDSGDITIPSIPGSGIPPITIEDAATLNFEFDGYYVNGQYHIPVGGWGSLDLIGGIIFADSRAQSKLTGTDGSLSFNEANSSSDQGVMAGAAFTYKLADTVYLRGSAMYFQLDFDDVIDEPIRVGADLIWDF